VGHVKLPPVFQVLSDNVEGKAFPNYLYTGCSELGPILVHRWCLLNACT
jgi:hypothetical protein